MNLTLDRRRFLGLMGAAAAYPAMGRLAHAASPFAFQASWINDAEFAGYFTALDKGYYTDEGLDLAYLSGGPDVIPESTIIAGKADLTLTTPDTTIKAIVEQGAPFKIIGAQYQKNPVGIVSLAKNPIKEPKDLIGKTLAVPPVNVISVEAMLKISGVDKSQVTIVPYVPFTIKQAGEDAVSFLLYDFGFTIFNDTVVVTDEALKTKRKEIVAFLKASKKGWEENLKDPAAYPPTFKDTWFKGTGRSIENEVYFNAAQKPLIESPAGIFSMTDEAIEANIKALAEVGIAAKREHFDTSVLAEIA
jgi:ABC-type nitrate/sulfonate/bicarbonate transport system substrate-binding protein